MEKQRIYVSIDLKSFFASVECRERDLDPLTVNLVVADNTRTEKTICLAVSPSLKKYGISGRARLFEVVKKVKEINRKRLLSAGISEFSLSSYDDNELKQDKTKKLDYIVAPPRMALYIEYSTRIYGVYLKYVAPEDIHVYSIDEVFMDITDYIKTKGMTAREFTSMIINDVYKETGITATAGIGTNLYLSKVAMDIVAKHTEPDENGVRIAELDEMKYRKMLWSHRPITDFWRVGPGYAKSLESKGLYTMGDIAKCSLGKKGDYYTPELLYKMFGVNAELLIDHAWGYEPCTISEIKAYKPKVSQIGSGQVLKCPYDSEKARLIVKEMADLLVLELVDKGLLCDKIVLTIGYDIENTKKGAAYKGEVTVDRYGRRVPKHSQGTASLKNHTSSTKLIMNAFLSLYDDIVNENLLIRRINLSLNNVVPEGSEKAKSDTQISMFSDIESEKSLEKEEVVLKKEKNIQKAIINIKKMYGKNAVIKGMNLEEGSTQRERNRQIGGHKA